MELIDRWIRFACVVAGADYSLVRTSNSLDRMIIGGNAVVLLLVGTLALVVWAAMFAAFLPLPLALPLGLLIAALVFMLDRAMSMSDWSLSGVLRSGPAKPGDWLKLLFRVAIALVLAWATALGAVLVLFADAVDDHIHRDRLARNMPVMAEAAEQKQRARQRLAAPLESEVALLDAERERLQQTLGERESALLVMRQRASQSRIEAERESEGGLRGYVPGQGPRFREAMRQEREANAAAALAAQDSARTQQRFDDLAERVADKRDELRQASALVSAEERRIDAAMPSDPRWVPARSGPLSRLVALEQMRADPTTGIAIGRVEWVTKATLIVLELTFLLIKTLLSPASVYLVKLTLRTKLDAVREVHQFNQALRDLRREQAMGRTERASTRLLDAVPEGDGLSEGGPVRDDGRGSQSHGGGR